MKITFLGQAGIFIETRHGSILCDPWFNPAYFASWFPFPSNEEVDREKLARPTYLYVSHLHHDHFDPQFLREHVWKEATVILPEALALPLIEVAGSKGTGDPIFNEIFHPIARRLILRTDAVLRIGGPSRGADEMIALAQEAGQRIYLAISEIATVQS